MLSQIKNETAQFYWALEDIPLYLLIIKITIAVLVTVTIIAKLYVSFRGYMKCKNDQHYKLIMFLHYLYFVVMILNIIYQLVIDLIVILGMMFWLANFGLFLQLKILFERIVNKQKKFEDSISQLSKEVMRQKSKEKKLKFMQLLWVLFMVSFLTLVLPIKQYGLLFCVNFYQKLKLPYGYFLTMAILIAFTFIVRIILRSETYRFRNESYLEQTYDEKDDSKIFDVQVMLDKQKTKYKCMNTCIIMIELILIILWLLTEYFFQYIENESIKRHRQHVTCIFYDLQYNIRQNDVAGILQVFHILIAIFPMNMFYSVFYKIPLKHGFFEEQKLLKNNKSKIFENLNLNQQN